MDDSNGSATLICGVNWLGDSIMSMPAVQYLKARDPGVRIVLLVKPKLRELWEMHPGVDEIVTLYRGIRGLIKAVSRIRRIRCSRAFIFPNSFRSALVPWLSGVRERVGRPGQFRSLMLSRRTHPHASRAPGHQSQEYLQIVGLADGAEFAQAPRLEIPGEAVERVRRRWGLNASDVMIGLIPGAARGPSKRWPEAHFIRAGRMLCAEGARRILVLGSREEHELCGRVAAGVGAHAANAAGETSLHEFAALLGCCRVVIANDSGGMHVAAAAGVLLVVGLSVWL